MNLVLGICAAVAALIGAGLLWWRSRTGKEIALMASLETSGAGSIAQAAPGTVVEVKGTLRVRTPLTAEFSGQPCAYFKCEIEREETYWERDSQGRDQRKTRTTTVYTNVKNGQCLVEDTTGRVGLDFDGAEVEAVETVNEPTAAPNATGGGMLGTVLSAISNTNSTYRRKESILGADIPVYVLGEVREGGLIGKPARRLEEQDLRDQPQVRGRADEVAHLDHAMAARDRDLPVRAGCRLRLLRREGRAVEEISRNTSSSS